jgi:ATP-dependent Lon protease
MAEYYQKNKETITKSQKEYYVKNKDKVIARKIAWSKLNPESLKTAQAKYAKNNPEKFAIKASTRRARLLKATPKWLTESDIVRMNAKYQLAAMFNEYTGEEWAVDHIYPLKGKEVCGLHVPSNLRVIPWLENVKKGNRIIEEKV